MKTRLYRLLILALALTLTVCVALPTASAARIPAFDISLARSGVTDPGLVPGDFPNLSGVSETAPTTHTMIVNGNRDQSVIHRGTVEPQLLVVEWSLIEPLAGVTPTCMSCVSGSSIWSDSGQSPYQASAGCDSYTGVSVQLFYREAMDASGGQGWNKQRKMQLTPILTIGGNTPYAITAAVVAKPYIKPYFEGGTTAWGRVEGSVYLLDLPAQLPTGMLDVWEVGEGALSGGTCMSVQIGSTYNPSATTGYPLQDGANIVRLEATGDLVYYTLDGTSPANTESNILPANEDLFLSRELYKDFRVLGDDAISYLCIHQLNNRLLGASQ